MAVSLRRIVSHCVTSVSRRPVSSNAPNGVQSAMDCLPIASLVLAAGQKQGHRLSLALDPAPGILWEASVMGCNVVASRGCGNWQLCHDALLAQPDQLYDFVQKIRVAFEKQAPGQHAVLRRFRSYEDLVQTIKAVARS